MGGALNPGRRSLRELALGYPAKHLRCESLSFLSIIPQSERSNILAGFKVNSQDIRARNGYLVVKGSMLPGNRLLSYHVKENSVKQLLIRDV